MISIQRSKFGFLKIAEAYFAENSDCSRLKADIAMFVRCATPGPGLSEARTLVIDLSRREDAILAECSKTTRYEIRRSAKEGMSVLFLRNPTLEQVERFRSFYRGFAKKKKRPPADLARLSALNASGALALASVGDPSGAELVHHAYVVDNDPGRAMLLYAASHFRDCAESPDRNMIARGHRYLCWTNIVAFRELGFRTYDLGGIPPDDADRELQQIAFFKRGFGGRELVEYSGHIGLTVLGKIACAVR